MIWHTRLCWAWKGTRGDIHVQHPLSLHDHNSPRPKAPVWRLLSELCLFPPSKSPAPNDIQVLPLASDSVGWWSLGSSNISFLQERSLYATFSVSHFQRPTPSAGRVWSPLTSLSSGGVLPSEHHCCMALYASIPKVCNPSPGNRSTSLYFGGTDSCLQRHHSDHTIPSRS